MCLPKFIVIIYVYFAFLEFLCVGYCWARPNRLVRLGLIVWAIEYVIRTYFIPP